MKASFQTIGRSLEFLRYSNRLSVVSKLFEKLVYKQVFIFLDENKVLTQFQSGFRKGHSTCTSLLSTTNNWLINMDRGLINGVIFLDLKKAFDTVDHEILIKKLELYGIRGNCQRWFVSYLSNRTQICKVGKIYSSKMYVKTGVPQGYNLGPLLFLLFLNDLSNCLSTLQIISMSQYLVPLWRILKLS